MNSETLVAEVMRLLALGRKASETPIQRLNRLVREQLPAAPTLTEETLVVSRRALSIEELRAIKPWHKRESPKFLDGALVLAEMGSQLVIIDGANRRNHFLRIGAPGPFDVRVIHVSTSDGNKA